MDNTPLPAFSLTATKEGLFCKSDLAGALQKIEEHNPGLRQRLEGEPLQEVAQQLEDLLREAHRRAPDAVADNLQQALGKILDCAGGCYCFEAEWFGRKHNVEKHLKPFAGDRWSTREGGDYHEWADLDNVYAYLVKTQHGWDEYDRVEAQWDGIAVLTLTYGSGEESHSVILDLLTPEEARAASLWLDSSLEDGIARRIQNLPAALLKAACEYIGETGWDTGKGTFPEAVETLQYERFEDLSPHQQEIVTKLAPEWEKTLSELLETARTI